MIRQLALTLVMAVASFGVEESTSAAGPCTCPQDTAMDGSRCGDRASSVRNADTLMLSTCAMLARKGLDSRSLEDFEGSSTQRDPRSFGREGMRSPSYEPVCGLYEFGCNGMGR